MRTSKGNPLIHIQFETADGRRCTQPAWRTWDCDKTLLLLAEAGCTGFTVNGVEWPDPTELDQAIRTLREHGATVNRAGLDEWQCWFPWTPSRWFYFGPTALVEGVRKLQAKLAEAEPPKQAPEPVRPVNRILLGYNFIDHGGGSYTVLSPSRNQYEVMLDPPSCSCPDFLYRGDRQGLTCKHIELIRQELADAA